MIQQLKPNKTSVYKGKQLIQVPSRVLKQRFFLCFFYLVVFTAFGRFLQNHRFFTYCGFYTKLLIINNIKTGLSIVNLKKFCIIAC